MLPGATPAEPKTLVRLSISDASPTRVDVPCASIADADAGSTPACRHACSIASRCPIGFGAVHHYFAPDGMTFEDYFGLRPTMSEDEKLANFGAGIDTACPCGTASAAAPATSNICRLETLVIAITSQDRPRAGCIRPLLTGGPL